MKCSSCGQQKNELKARNSKIIKSMRLFMCQTCTEKELEPRYVIIIYLRSRREGDDSKNLAEKFVKNRQYLGKEITLAETI